MHSIHRPHRLSILLLATVFAAAPALAAPPPWAGGGKQGGDDRVESPREGKGKGKKEERERAGNGGQREKSAKRSDARPVKQGAYFDDRSRDAVQRYYASAGKGGKGCPPGLAKKNNGCLPPGQAKKWQVGQPLPRDVVFYPVPQQIVVALPPVPVGHRYVQVAGDILLIAAGSKMVVDGMTGLMSR